MSYSLDGPIGYDPLVGPDEEEQKIIDEYWDAFTKRKAKEDAQYLKEWKERHD